MRDRKYCAVKHLSEVIITEQSKRITLNSLNSPVLVQLSPNIHYLILPEIKAQNTLHIDAKTN